MVEIAGTPALHPGVHHRAAMIYTRRHRRCAAARRDRHDRETALRGVVAELSFAVKSPALHPAVDHRAGVRGQRRHRSDQTSGGNRLHRSARARRAVVAELPREVGSPTLHTTVDDGTGVHATKFAVGIAEQHDTAYRNRGGVVASGNGHYRHQTWCGGAVAELAVRVSTPTLHASVDQRAAISAACLHRACIAAGANRLHRDQAWRGAVVAELTIKVVSPALHAAVDCCAGVAASHWRSDTRKE